MKHLRLFLLVAGSVLVLGAITGYLTSAAPKPTLVLIGGTGMAFLFWHNAAVVFQRWTQGQK